MNHKKYQVVYILTAFIVICSNMDGLYGKPNTSFSQSQWSNGVESINKNKEKSTTSLPSQINKYNFPVPTTTNSTPTKPEILVPPGIIILLIFGATCWACCYHPRCLVARMRQRRAGVVYQTIVTEPNVTRNQRSDPQPSGVIITTTTTTTGQAPPPPAPAPVNITNYNHINAPYTVHGNNNVNVPSGINPQQPQPQQYYYEQNPGQQNFGNQIPQAHQFQGSAYPMPMPNHCAPNNFPPQYAGVHPETHSTNQPYNPHFFHDGKSRGDGVTPTAPSPL